MKYLLAVSLTLLSTALLANRRAQADDTSYNLEAVQGSGLSHSYNSELGARASAILPGNLFVGADYAHFFSDNRAVRNITGASLEVGYRIDTPPKFELIPYLGAGAAFVSQSFGAGTADRFLANPGVKIDYPIGQLVLGIDNEYEIVPFHNSYVFAWTFGVRF